MHCLRRRDWYWGRRHERGWNGRATEVLMNLNIADLKDLTLSLVRVNGANAPKGRVMVIGEMRVEVSTDDPFERVKRVEPVGRPKSNAYTEQ